MKEVMCFLLIEQLISTQFIQKTANMIFFLIQTSIWVFLYTREQTPVIASRRRVSKFSASAV